MDILSLLSKALQGGGQQEAANPLAQLLGFQDQQQQDPMLGEGNVDPRTIEVAAASPRQRGPIQPAVDEEPLNLANADILREAQAAGENAPQRKQGYFGTKGTLRNILGAVSDAFLVQGGADAQYAPLRERERLSDAMTGYTQNPQAAAERMAYQGFGNESSKVWNDSQVQEVNRGTLETRQKEAERKLFEDNDQRYKQYGTLFSQYAGSTDERTWPRVKEILKTLKERGGLGPEYEIPEEYDPVLMKTYQFGGMPATQQVRSVDKNEDQAWDKEKFGRAEAGRMARDNPPAGRNPPRPESESEYKARIRAKIGKGTATKAEIDSITIGGRSKGSTRSTDRKPVTPPGTFKGWSSKPRQ